MPVRLDLRLKVNLWPKLTGKNQVQKSYTETRWRNQVEKPGGEFSDPPKQGVIEVKKGRTRRLKLW